MASINFTDTSFGLPHAPNSFVIRLGKREIILCRDFRRRYYPVHFLLDCCIGTKRGYSEWVLLRKWLIILSPAE